jgi:mRNA-degrading endonuclease RelE of RelBE toxin-antitoxin system
MARALDRQHPHVFADQLEEALSILREDPYNRHGRHAIKKLQGVAQSEGQYRLRLGRWRFRYDISDSDVILMWAGLRREDTYR